MAVAQVLAPGAQWDIEHAALAAPEFEALGIGLGLESAVEAIVGVGVDEDSKTGERLAGPAAFARPGFLAFLGFFAFLAILAAITFRAFALEFVALGG
jgi:hypothetical protein